MARTATQRELLKSERHVKLWRISHKDGPNIEAFLVKDPKRTPEDWPFNLRAEADAKFEERVKNAKTEPPLLP